MKNKKAPVDLIPLGFFYIKSVFPLGYIRHHSYLLMINIIITAHANRTISGSALPEIM